MNRKMILYFIGWILKIEALCMLLPVFTAIFYEEKQMFVFLYTGIACAALSFLICPKKPENSSFYTREGFVSVGFGWLILSFSGALPFVIDGCIPRYIDALFEVISGFTTTGATILSDVEVMPKSMLLWRSFTHWLGGMGVLMFIMALLPNASQNSMHIVRAESPGPTAGKFVAKSKDSAFILYAIYFGITILEIITLICSGMRKFDAILISFGTVGTGGFGVLNDSCGSYTPAQQVIITVFMLLCGTNFAFYYFILTKRVKDAFKLEEVRVYFLIVLASGMLIMLNILSRFGNVLDAMRHSFFQVASIMTTTGYATVDFDLWPTFSKTILITLMFIGACTGSTGGGLKVLRIILCYKSIRRELMNMIHPRNVKVLRFSGKPVEKETVRSVNSYVMTYILLFAGSLLIVSLDGFNFETTFTAITATINNIGPGIGGVGPMVNYSGFSDLSKLVMCFDMLAGRLELFPMILLFSMRTWRQSL